MTEPITYADPISADEFMAAAPKSVSGSSAWASRYAAEVRRIWLAHAAQDPRTLQQHLGPSELGAVCDRQVVGKLAALPETNHVVDPWPSLRGKALHRHAEDVFQADNARSGLLRWLTETRVTPHPEHPGTADLYDTVERCVDDHKFLGDSSMTKVRLKAGPPRHYQVQLLLYGLGYHLMGLPVTRVVLIAYPATAGSLDGLYVWERRFLDDVGNIAPEVVELLTEVFAQTETRKAYAAAVLEHRMGFLDVPSIPSSDECYFCPFYRPQAAKDGGSGCPGTAKAVAP